MRAKLLSSVKRVVIKVGSGVISTDIGLDGPMIDAISADICALIRQGYEIALVSSGAISAGKQDLFINDKPPSIPLKQAAAAIGQSRLMRYYKKAFRNENFKVGQVLLTREDLADRKRYLNARNTVKTLLEYRVTPIINENDTVAVEEIKFGDNDNLSAMVTALVEAQLLVILTDVDGLYNRDPRKHAEAERLAVVEKVTPAIEAMAGDSSTRFGTGGMVTKIQAAKRAALSGVGTLIVNGRTPSILRRVMNGDSVGTLFLPAAKKMAAKKHWIAFTKKTSGKLVLDDGAVRAILHQGKSLLPSGIRQVEGKFGRGDMVSLYDLQEREIGRGVTDYAQGEILQIMGQKSSRIREILGYKYHEEVIHRDDMVIRSPNPSQDGETDD
jgi:glutamate 5-kinase